MIHRVSILDAHVADGIDKRLSIVKAILVNRETMMHSFVVSQPMFNFHSLHHSGPLWVGSYGEIDVCASYDGRQACNNKMHSVPRMHIPNKRMLNFRRSLDSSSISRSIASDLALSSFWAEFVNDQGSCSKKTFSILV